MHTAWIRMRRRVTRRLIQIQAVWHSDNSFTNFGWDQSNLKIEADDKLADDNLFDGLRVKFLGWYDHLKNYQLRLNNKNPGAANHCTCVFFFSTRWHHCLQTPSQTSKLQKGKPYNTVMRIIKLKIFPVPVRLHSGYVKLILSSFHHFCNI